MTRFNFVSLYTLTVLATSIWLSTTLAGAKPVYPHQKVARQITAQSVSCFPLQLADAAKLPAWHKIKEYLDKTYGEGFDTLHFNDPLSAPSAPPMLAWTSLPSPYALQNSPSAARRDHRWRSNYHKDHTLKALNPALTQLKLSLYHDAYDDLITNPLMSTIADGFPRLDALQSFEVDIYLDSRCRRLNWRTSIRNAGSGNDTWAKLDNALSGIISLKEVRMRFHIEFFDKGWLVVTREAAEGVREHIMETVYPSHFRGLCARRDRAEVEFEYVVNLTAL